MKLLLDQNLSFKLCIRIQEIFPSSAHVRLLGLDTSDDRTIWQFAKEHHFTILTQDSDFAEMVGLYGPPPKVVWLRCGNQPTDYFLLLLHENAERIQALESDSVLYCLELK